VVVSNGMTRDLVVSKMERSKFVGPVIVTRAASVAVDAVQRFRSKKTASSTCFTLIENSGGGIQDARGRLSLLVGRKRIAIGFGAGR
jgi:hypothetical protein